MNTARWVVGYRPAPWGTKDWAAKDQWVGPFRIPDNGTITRMAAYGSEGMLLATHQGIYLADCRQMIEKAAADRSVCSTEQWRTKYEQRLLSSGWQNLLPLLLAEGKWDQAAELLSKQRDQLTRESDGRTGLKLNLWYAHLLARKGDLAGAIKRYDQAAAEADRNQNRPAEVFARMNQVVLLHKAGRFQEMLDLLDAVKAKFWQTSPGENDEPLIGYVRDARKHLAAKAQPTTLPEAKPK